MKGFSKNFEIIGFILLVVKYIVIWLETWDNYFIDMPKADLKIRVV